VIALTAVLAVGAPAARASITIGSTKDPDSVAIRGGNGDVVVKFRPAAEGYLRKYWLASAFDLVGHRFSLSTVPWRRTPTCASSAITYDDPAQAPGVPASALSGAHAMRTISCDAGDGITIRVQLWHQQAPDFGTLLNGDAMLTVNVSVVHADYAASGARSPNPDGTVPQTGAYMLPTIGATTFNGWPILQGQPRFSKFSPGGYKGYLAGKHFTTLFGSFTYGGVGVWGKAMKSGNPTDAFGRNAYIDTFNSDFGDGWRRIVGVLTQKPNGTFCYELSPKGGANGGSHGRTGYGEAYTLTVQGPGTAPDARVYVTNPAFTFGNDAYNAKTDKWGTNFSDGQAQALRNQVAMIGPGYLEKPKGKHNTDCGQQLRQLPPSFYAPPPQ
jgi:hypothetical protein